MAIRGQAADYVDVLEAYNEVMEKAKKGRKVPTANPYLLAVQKSLSDRVYPHYRKRRSYTIIDCNMPKVRTTDRLTPEELRRMKASQAATSNQ